jgi:4-hydroxy-tetrahydrodipicolinate reductase
MTGVVLAGACGRMGGEVARMLAACEDMTLVGGVEAFGHPLVGTPLGRGMVVAELVPLLARADVVVDFSVPDAAVEHAGSCAMAERPFVTGVTGLSADQHARLAAAARKIPVVNAPNFSVGVAVLSRLVAEAARSLGSEYDVEVVETHHRRKADAPSGTARLLVKTIQSARSVTGVRHGREGSVGAKSSGEVGVSAIRTGEVVGEHLVIFGGPGERIELRHKAESRAAFAAGVIAAIRFVQGRKPGLYSMADVLAP